MVRLVVVLLLVCGVVVGCGAAEPEGPFTPRPAEIDVANVDPCVAMTPELRQQWGVEGDEPSTVTLADGPSRVCGWGNYETIDNYAVQTIQTPAAKIATASGAVITAVDGFGAVRMVERRGSSDLCELYLDIADAASVRVQVDDFGGARQSGRPSDAACDRAETLARALLSTARED